jgi:hypothetical protein
MLRRVALVRTDVSEEFSSSFITVTREGEEFQEQLIDYRGRSVMCMITQSRRPVLHAGHICRWQSFPGGAVD